jgi:hypothetical protein
VLVTAQAAQQVTAQVPVLADTELMDLTAQLSLAELQASAVQDLGLARLDTALQGLVLRQAFTAQQQL